LPHLKILPTLLITVSKCLPRLCGILSWQELCCFWRPNKLSLNEMNGSLNFLTLSNTLHLHLHVGKAFTCFIIVCDYIDFKLKKSVVELVMTMIPFVFLKNYLI